MNFHLFFLLYGNAFNQSKQKLETRCKIHDIQFIIQEESYASKSSFLDEDILPEFQEKKMKKKRIMWNIKLKVNESNVDYTKHKKEKLSMQM
jgi:hypothetical protein